MFFVLGILWYFCWKLILCLVSDEWGPIGPYETDLSDYVAGSTKFNKFYSSSLMVEHFTFLDDFNNTWIITKKNMIFGNMWNLGQFR